MVDSMHEGREAFVGIAFFCGEKQNLMNAAGQDVEMRAESL